MANTNTHECVAEHCVVCCPAARAYSDGVQVGKDLYTQDEHEVRLTAQGVGLAAGIIVAGIMSTLALRRVQHADNVGRGKSAQLPD